MSSNDTSGPIPIRFRHANPLLFTLQQDHMTIQPYWIMVLQILALQLVQRIWNLIRYGEFLSTIEIGFLRWVLWYQMKKIDINLEDVDDVLEDIKGTLRNLFAIVIPILRIHRVNTEKRYKRLLEKFNFDLFDFIFYFLPLFGHAVWYCYIQSRCMSAKDATTWNCYNAFGYRLFNYIFVSYANFFWIFIIKFIALFETNSPQYKKWSYDWFSYHLGLWSSIITFVFDGCLMVPYLLTHVIPMICAYLFMTIVYVALLSAIMCFAYFLWDEIPIIKKLLPVPGIISTGYRKTAMIPYVVALGMYTYPILLSTLYNYSQYLYYGENYIYTLSNEFSMRDTTRYLEILQNSTNEKFHSALNFI